MNKTLNYFFLILIAIFSFSCEEQELESQFNYIAFEENPTIRVPENTTDSFDVKVFSGNISGNSRTFGISVNSATNLQSPYTVPTSVTIPANSNEGILSISVTDDMNLGFLSQDLILDIEELGDINYKSTSVTIDVAEQCPGTVAVFSLELDTWPDETTWEIYDISSSPAVLIASGGPYNNPADDFALITQTFCFLPGDYGVVVYDAYGDGINSDGYSITDVDGNVLTSSTVTGGGSSSTFTVN